MNNNFLNRENFVYFVITGRDSVISLPFLFYVNYCRYVSIEVFFVVIIIVFLGCYLLLLTI